MRSGQKALAGAELWLSSRAQGELMRAVLERGACFRFRALGGSMAPLIRAGDILTIAPLNGALQPGDVVAVQRFAAGPLLVHRAVKRSDAGWLIRGDNRPRPDGVFAESALIGRLVRLERNGHELRLGSPLERRLLACLSRHGLWHRFWQAAAGVRRAARSAWAGRGPLAR